LKSLTANTKYYIRVFAYDQLTAAGSGSNTVDSTTLVAPPSISANPVNASAVAGTTASFSVTATGASSYQWRKNGVTVATGTGGTTASYTTAALAQSDNGATFDCVVSNAGGSVTSTAATLTVCTAPAITTQPSPSTQAVCPNSVVDFSVVASGTPPTFTYQWYRGTTAVGTNSSSFHISSAQSGDAGDYKCVVSNGCGTAATSSIATLTVNANSTAPSNSSTSICSGSSVTLNETGGTLGAGASWKWYATSACNGTVLSSTSSYTTPALTASTDYYVRAEGTCNTTTPAKMTVNVTPNFTLTENYVTENDVVYGSGITLSVTANPSSGVNYQWEKSVASTGVWTAMGGETSSSLTVTPQVGDSFIRYRCTATNGCFSHTTTNVANVYLNFRLKWSHKDSSNGALVCFVDSNFARANDPYPEHKIATAKYQSCTSSSYFDYWDTTATPGAGIVFTNADEAEIAGCIYSRVDVKLTTGNATIVAHYYKGCNFCTVP
jgi:hypothetical protein